MNNAYSVNLFDQDDLSASAIEKLCRCLTINLTRYSSLAGLTAASNATTAGIIVDTRSCRGELPQILPVLAKRFLGIPILVVSDEGSIHDAVIAIQSGASDYLQKPLLETQLQQYLYDIMQQM